MSRRLLAPEAAALWSVPAAPIGAGLFTNTAGLQKLADIIQVGPGAPCRRLLSPWKWGASFSCTCHSASTWGRARPAHPLPQSLSPQAAVPPERTACLGPHCTRGGGQKPSQVFF